MTDIQETGRLIPRQVKESLQKLNLGCGDHPIDGWINADIARLSDGILFLDATRRFPFDDSTLDRIFTEHMIEHLGFRQGIECLSECYRVLKPGGRIRVSTPDMMFLVSLITNPCNLVNETYISWAAREFNLPAHPLPVATAAVVNHFVRAWGHLFIWTQDSLCLSMTAIGFRNFQRCSIGTSADDEFKGLENVSRMPSGLLQLETMTFEAEKPL